MENYKALNRNKEAGSTHSLLAKGMVPGIIYGKGSEPTKIALEDKILKKLMHTCLLNKTPLPRDATLTRMPSTP